MTLTRPDYSIVVPTYRRQDQLGRCLSAIEAVDFPRARFEVLVVDDGSPTPPTDLVASLDRSLNVQLVCVRHRGPAAARNAGARRARGRYLVFTDDDCAPRQDWMRAIDRSVTASTGPLMIGGHTVNRLADNIYATASQAIVDFLYAYFGGHSAERRFFTTNNLVVPRAEFLTIGGFDEGFELAAAEDRDLCERWHASGRELQYAPDAIVEHAHVLNFAQFNRQHFHYGRGAFDLHRSRARRGRASLDVEPLRFYLGLITNPLRPSLSWRGVQLAFLHFWSQVAYVSGYLFERIRRGWAVRSGEGPTLGQSDGDEIVESGDVAAADPGAQGNQHLTSR
jgi:glycosyltransferase involved in cell wall biosynthesis